MNYCFTMQKECKWCGAMGQCTATAVCSEQSNIVYSNRTLVASARGNGKTLTSLAKQLSITYDIPFEKALKIVYESYYGE